MSKKWKVGDIITPRLKSNLVIKIIESPRGKYVIKYLEGFNKNKETIESKYLDCSYINENGKRIYNWIKKGDNDEQNTKTNNTKN